MTNASCKGRPARLGFLTALAALIALCLLALSGCVQQAARLAPAPPAKPVDIENVFSFRVRDLNFVPLAGARIDLFVGSGRIKGPLSLKVDSRGRAQVRVSPQVSRQIPEFQTTDTLLNYRTAIRYRITAPGFLPVWGVAEIEDAWESYRRSDFAVRLNRRPQARSQLITETMIPINSLLAAEPQASPAVQKLIKAGLLRLWRSWGAARVVRPTPGMWDLTTRPGGVFLKAGVSPVIPVAELSNTGIYDLFVSTFLPLLDDLEATFGRLVDGWDLTVVIETQPGNDPYAIPKKKALRLVVSAKTLDQVRTLPGGLNNLILKAEVCTFDEETWNPLVTLEKDIAKSRQSWDWLDPLLAPGSSTE